MADPACGFALLALKRTCDSWLPPKTASFPLHFAPSALFWCSYVYAVLVYAVFLAIVG